MDLDNRYSGPDDFDPRFAPPGYAPPRPQPPRQSQTPLIAGGVVLLVIVVALVAIGSSRKHEFSYRAVDGPGFRIQVPQHFVPVKLQNADRTLKLSYGDQKEGTVAIVHFLDRNEIPVAGVSLERVFDVIAEGMGEDDATGEMSETTTTRIGTRRALQQTVRFTRGGVKRTALQTAFETTDGFYFIEVNTPDPLWAKWEPRARHITESFVLP